MLSKLSQAENITEGETTGSDFLGYITSRRDIYTCLWIMWEPLLPMPFQMTLLGLKHHESHLTWALNVRKWEWAGPSSRPPLCSLESLLLWVSPGPAPRPSHQQAAVAWSCWTAQRQPGGMSISSHPCPNWVFV